jgi:hypothetical protein
MVNQLTVFSIVAYGCDHNGSVNLLSSTFLQFSVLGTLALH